MLPCEIEAVCHFGILQDGYQDITLWNFQLPPLWSKFWILLSNVCMKTSNTSDSSVSLRFSIALVWKNASWSWTNPSSLSLTISHKSIILTFISQFSLVILKTSGLAFSMNSLHPKPGAPRSGSEGSSILSILNCLMNLLTHWPTREFQTDEFCNF